MIFQIMMMMTVNFPFSLECVYDQSAPFLALGIEFTKTSGISIPSFTVDPWSHLMPRNQLT